MTIFLVYSKWYLSKEIRIGDFWKQTHLLGSSVPCALTHKLCRLSFGSQNRLQCMLLPPLCCEIFLTEIPLQRACFPPLKSFARDCGRNVLEFMSYPTTNSVLRNEEILVLTDKQSLQSLSALCRDQSMLYRNRQRKNLNDWNYHQNNLVRLYDCLSPMNQNFCWCLMTHFH